ncbi:MAG: prepilin-type N-terminal cleavage/methylation domain-containing protein, partial [Sedimentisphaerales bacterium]|nr:prepilin-type N-terminal cleavage/methylation domain-containing protein [Sedimentisphaerales bacterium]
LMELLIVISIIALLMAILVPALGKARKQAKDVACRANLRQWALAFSMYTNENDGRMFSRNAGYGTDPRTPYWYVLLKPYYRDAKLLLCPEAKTPTVDKNNNGTGARTPYAAWGFIFSPPYNIPPGYYGSYGLNYWVCDDPFPGYWKTTNVPQPGTIPVFGDCWMVCSNALDWNPPPLYDGYIEGTDPGQLGRHCVNRHDGSVNMLFLDGSARSVDLKELWTLRWSRDFDNENFYTIAGHDGDRAACAAVWDSMAYWMRNMPEY